MEDRKTVLPTEAKERKAVPLCTGVLDYFPDALADVARLSQVGNDQHNPGQPLHWSKHKSSDHGDCILRHQIDRGTRDTDGVRHSAKVAWRALAQLQIEIEAERAGLSVRDYLAKLKLEAEPVPTWADEALARMQSCAEPVCTPGIMTVPGPVLATAHNGGPRPVPTNTRVTVYFRDGAILHSAIAGYMDWSHFEPHPRDIVAYKVEK